MVVAQLLERSLPIPEVRILNPAIGKKYIEHFTVNCIEKDENKEKEAGNGSFKKIKYKYIMLFYHYKGSCEHL